MRSILILHRTRKGASGEWRWRVLDARNGRILGASTEGYVARRDAAKNYERLTGHNLPAMVRDREVAPLYGWLMLWSDVPRDERPTYRPLSITSARVHLVGSR